MSPTKKLKYVIARDTGSSNWCQGAEFVTSDSDLVYAGKWLKEHAKKCPGKTFYLLQVIEAVVYEDPPKPSDGYTSEKY